MHGHQVHRRAAESLPEPLQRVRLEAGRLLFERRSVAASRLRGQIEEDVEAVGAGETDGDEVIAEPGGGRVLLEAVGDDEKDAVVLLPAVELLEAEELSDLQVDDAQVIDALDQADPLRIFEGMDGQARHAVVDDPLLPKPFDRLRRSLAISGGRRSREENGGRRPATGLHRDAPERAGTSERTLCRSSSEAKGLAR